MEQFLRETRAAFIELAETLQRVGGEDRGPQPTAVPRPTRPHLRLVPPPAPAEDHSRRTD